MKVQSTKILPWGEEIYHEVQLHKSGSQDKFYARHGKTPDGQHYIEFSKFGPHPTDGSKTYHQKMRFYSLAELQKVIDVVNNELKESIGW